MLIIRGIGAGCAPRCPAASSGAKCCRRQVLLPHGAWGQQQPAAAKSRGGNQYCANAGDAYYVLVSLGGCRWHGCCVHITTVGMAGLGGARRGGGGEGLCASCMGRTCCSAHVLGEESCTLHVALSVVAHQPRLASRTGASRRQQQPASPPGAWLPGWQFEDVVNSASDASGLAEIARKFIPIRSAGLRAGMSLAAWPPWAVALWARRLGGLRGAGCTGVQWLAVAPRQWPREGCLTVAASGRQGAAAAKAGRQVARAYAVPRCSGSAALW